MNTTIAVVFVAGLFLGTLLNVVIIRLPRERNMGGKPHCTRCGQPLAWWQLLPVVGWLVQGGRGRCCGRRLNWIFPLVEFLMAALLVRFYLLYGSSPVFFYLAFVAAILLITGAIDWLHRSIYTFVILGAALIVLLASLGLPAERNNIVNGLLGLLVAGFFFAIFFMLARVMFPGKAAPFGLGDVYLAIFIGAAIGLTRLTPALFYGMLLAGVYSALLIILRRLGRSGAEYISYGTFLCLGTLSFLAWRGLS